MARRLVLHVGTMKSGTSFIQSVLTSNPTAMASQGFVFPSGRFGAQSRAVRDVLRKKARNDRRTLWPELIDAARSFDGDAAVVSMEFLSFAAPKKISEFLEPTRGMQVEVVLTVRDQFQAIPAQFQTYARNFGTDDWPTYLRSLESGSGANPTRAYRTFHRAQDVPSILQRWSGNAIAGVTVVTLPPPGAAPSLLWHRFSEAVGLDPQGFDIENLHSNQSIGFASCDYLRRLNSHISNVSPAEYRKGMRPTIREALAPLRSSEGRPQLDGPGAEFAAHLNQKIRTAVDRHQPAVVGSIDDLPVHTAAESPGVMQPPAGQVLRAAEAVSHYCSRALGSADPEPTSNLDDAVSISAGLLHQLRGWK